MKQKVRTLLPVIAVCLALAALFLWESRPEPVGMQTAITHRRSSCTGPGDGRFHILTEPARYPLGTTAIPFEVTNEGEYSGEIHQPVLEAEKNGTWYQVDQWGGDVPANLLGIRPGATIEFYVYPYDLPAGHYRGVFYLAQEDGWFAYEFELY